jgi:hypothetical protein
VWHYPGALPACGTATIAGASMDGPWLGISLVESPGPCLPVNPRILAGPRWASMGVAHGRPAARAARTLFEGTDGQAQRAAGSLRPCLRPSHSSSGRSTSPLSEAPLTRGPWYAQAVILAVAEPALSGCRRVMCWPERSPCSCPVLTGRLAGTDLPRIPPGESIGAVADVGSGREQPQPERAP